MGVHAALSVGPALRYAKRRNENDLKRALLSAGAEDGRLWSLGNTVVNYLLRTSAEAGSDAILKAAESSSARETVMTIAEALEREGAVKNHRAVLERQLSRKFGLTDQERDRIRACDNMHRLGDALDEIIIAETKAEVLAKLT